MLASALQASFDNNLATEKPKIIFMTGRQSQHRIVVDTVRQINSRIPEGIPKITLIDIIGREGMCEYVDRSTGKCSCEGDVVEETRKARRSDLRKKLLEEPRHVDWNVKYGKSRKSVLGPQPEWYKHADILVCDYNHVFVERVERGFLPAMGIELENSILIVDEAHNLPDRIRSGLERRVTDDVFNRALDNIEEYKGNLEKANSNLDLPESGQLRDVRHLEMQVKSSRSQ